MLKQIREAFQEQPMRLTQVFQARCRGCIKHPQVHQDRCRHLMLENGRQFLGLPQARSLFAGRQYGRQFIRTAFEHRFRRIRIKFGHSHNNQLCHPLRQTGHDLAENLMNLA